MKRLLYTLSSLVLLVGLCLTVFSRQVAAQAASSANEPIHTYVALGDSMASGAGLPLNINDPDGGACQRSSQSYPFQVARSIGIALEHEACGGATVKKGILGEQQAGSTTLPAQIDQAFKQGTPRLISLTIGGNDIKWADFIQKCYTDTCGTWADSMRSNLYLWRLHQNLRTALDQIAARSGETKPLVILTGYYIPVTGGTECADTTGLDTEETAWIQQRASLLNAVLGSMTYWYDYVKFAPVDFTGHELCSAEPWIQGMRDPAPYHPTQEGQSAIGRAVFSAAGDRQW